MRHLIGVLIFALSLTAGVFLGNNLSFDSAKTTSTQTHTTKYKLDSSWVYMSYVSWEYPPKEILETYKDKFQDGGAVFLIFYPSGEFFKVSCHVRKFDSGRIDAYGPDIIVRQGRWIKEDNGFITTTSRVTYAPYGPKGICDEPLKSERLTIVEAGVTGSFLPGFTRLPKNFMDLDWLEDLTQRNFTETQCTE